MLTPDIYDPTLNPLYRDVLAHYGVVALPCRVGDPDRKGKVESGVGHAQKTPLKGLRFETLEEAQAYLDRWEAALGRHAHPRHHQAPGRRDVCRGAAGACCRCRSSRFAITTTASARCISMAASKSRRAYYGAPPGWIGRRVQVQWDALHVRLLDPQTRSAPARAPAPAPRAASHRRRRSPQRNAAQQRVHCWPAPPRPAPTSAQLCQAIHRNEGELRRPPHPRRARRWPRNTASAAVDDACAAALDLGVRELSLRAPLSRAPPAMPLTLRQVDPLIRQLTLYRDLIDRKTKENPQ